MTEALKQFTKDGKFLMLAFDHRGSFRKFLNPEDPNSVTTDQAIEAKKAVIAALSDQFSGLLIDIETGLPAYQHKTAPYLLPLEASGYIEDGGGRIAKIEHTAKDLKELGAHGAKVLFYFNPVAPGAAKQLEIAQQVSGDCKEAEFPLFLEIRVYPETAVTPGLVEQSVQAFKDAGVIPDVWKLEYPGNLEGCKELTKLADGVPWILLTAGVSFDQFIDQLKEAAAAGAEGFLAGRAVWQEAYKLKGEDQTAFIETTLPERFRQISTVILEA